MRVLVSRPTALADDKLAMLGLRVGSSRDVVASSALRCATTTMACALSEDSRQLITGRAKVHLLQAALTSSHLYMCRFVSVHSETSVRVHPPSCVDEGTRCPLKIGLGA